MDTVAYVAAVYAGSTDLFITGARADQIGWSLFLQHQFREQRLAGAEFTISIQITELLREYLVGFSSV